MKILVSFEAESVERLREQMEAFLAGPKPTLRERVEATKAKEALNGKAAKKTAPVVETPLEPPAEPPLEPSLEELDPVTPDATLAIELHRLKEEQLTRLRELFTAGKGTLVRQLLAKYGDGAKVFPEIDAAKFPLIKAELDKELGVQ